MMKINKLSIIGFCAGIIYILVTIVQYWIRYSDLDKFISNIAIASMVIGIAYLYDKVKKSEISQEKNEEDLQNLHLRVRDLENGQKPKEN